MAAMGPETEEYQQSKDRQPRTLIGKALLHFTPAWFVVVMATAIVAIIIHDSPHKFRGMDHIGTAFFVLSCLLFILFLLANAARFIFYPWVFMRMLKDPMQAMFASALPTGLAILVECLVLIVVPHFGQRVVMAVWVLWWIDVALTVLFSFGIPFIMFYWHDLDLDEMTAVWLLPIVPMVVASAAGGLVASVLDIEHAFMTLIVSYVLWGAGMGLSFMFTVLYLHRLTVHSLPEAKSIVTALLPLEPLGQGSYAIIQLATAGRAVLEASHFAAQGTSGGALPEVLQASYAAEAAAGAALPAVGAVFYMSTLAGLLIWGLGVWWLVLGLMSLFVRLANKNLKFSLEVWGFIFPLGVFTSATIRLAAVLPSAFLAYLSLVSIAVVVLLWIGTAATTLQGVVAGTWRMEHEHGPELTNLPNRDVVACGEMLKQPSASTRRAAGFDGEV